MGTINLVWCKLASGNVWWVGEKLDEVPEDLGTAVKNKNIQVVKFFDPDEAFHTVKNPSHIVPYETDKEDYITKGLKLLKKKPQMLQNFKNDVAEAEKKIGGDENIIERLEPKPADSTPRKSIVAEIFKTPVVEEKTPERKTPPSNAAASKAVKKTGSPRKPKGPTPQIQTDGKKFHCEKCGFGTDRMNVLIVHLKIHTDGPTTPAVASTSTPRASRVSTPIPQTPVVQPVRPPSTRKSIKSTPKATPVPAPKRVSQPRKRKLATSPEDSKPEVAKAEILADWSDGDEDVGVGAVRETRKKAKTSKDLFDSLFQSKVSSEDGTEDSEPPKLDDSSSNDRRSDDDMDTDELPMLSGSSALVNLPKSSPVQDKKDEVNTEVKDEVNAEIKDEVNAEIKDEVNAEVKDEVKDAVTDEVKDAVTDEVKDEVKEEVQEEVKDEVKEEIEDFDTQFNELMSETAFKLPTFPSKSQPIVGSEKVEEQVETKSAPVEVASKIEEKEKQPETIPEVKISTDKLKAVTPRRQTTKTEEAKVAETPVKNVEIVKPSSPQKPTAEVKSIPSTPKTSVSPVKTYSSPTRQASPAKVQPAPPTPKSPTKTVAGTKASPQVAPASTVKTPVQVVKPDASSTPVYARKSAPKPIEPEPARRTSARGRRPSAKAAEAAEAAAPAASSLAKVAESVVATKSKPPQKLPTPAEPKAAPTPAKATSSTEALKAEEPTKSSAPAKEQKAQPETPKRTSVSEPVEQKIVADTMTIQPSPAAIKPVEASLATETPKKPTATSAPTASSLALAQRKQQQQQRGVVPAPPPPVKRQSRTYPGKKSTTTGSSESTQTKPTATVKPTVNVEDDSIIRQALQAQKQGAVKSTPTTAEPKKEVPVEHVVHLVPVQNPDGSVSYMLLSLNDSDQLQLDQFEGQAPPSSNLEAVYIDKPIDGETLMTTINPSAPVQPQQQIQLQLPQISQSSAKQPTASQQVKQIAAAAKASTAQPHLQATQFVTTEASAPQQYIIQQDGQEGAVLGSSLVQSEDGSFVDISQLAGGDSNIYFMTEDGSIIDPTGVNGIDFQQLFNTQ